MLSLVRNNDLYLTIVDCANVAFVSFTLYCFLYCMNLSFNTLQLVLQ